MSHSAEGLTNDFQMYTALHGQRQGQESEGVKPDTSGATLLTANAGLELAVKEVNHHRAVPQQVVVPRLVDTHTEQQI